MRKECDEAGRMKGYTGQQWTGSRVQSVEEGGIVTPPWMAEHPRIWNPADVVKFGGRTCVWVSWI